MKVKMLLIMIFISSFCLSGCLGRRANSWQKQATITALGAGTGYAVGKQKDDKTALIGAGVGGLVSYVAHQTYKKPEQESYDEGYEHGKSDTTINLLEKLEEEEMEGKELLRIGNVPGKTYYQKKRLEQY